jgi:hypothetical protein
VERAYEGTDLAGISARDWVTNLNLLRSVDPAGSRRAPGLRNASREKAPRRDLKSTVTSRSELVTVKNYCQGKVLRYC